MKIKFLATGVAPENYEFGDDELVIDGIAYDLSVFEEGDIFEGLEGEHNYIRDIKRIDGELYVTLCQKAPEGHWRGIDEWIDARDYNPNRLYIRKLTEEELEQEKQAQEVVQPEGKTTRGNKGVLKVRKVNSQ